LTDYTKATNFASKDSLSTGNPLKIVKGTEIDTEFNNIQTAIATKADLNSPTFSGSVTIVGGTITGITDLAVADGGTGASTAANARTNLGAAASGANSDITSITGLTTPLTVAQGGVGAATLTANNVLLGNGTSALQTVAPGSSGNVLTSNGTTWASSALPAGLSGLYAQVFTSNGTFTIPTGVTALKIIVQGGGGGGAGGSSQGGGGGGGGGCAIKYLTSLTSGNTLSVTVGSAGSAGGAGSNGGSGGNSQVASGTQTITTIIGYGGSAGITQHGGGSGGSTSGADISIVGSSKMYVSAGGSYGNGDAGGFGMFVRGPGAGGGGGYGDLCTQSAGSAGTAGIVIIEW